MVENMEDSTLVSSMSDVSGEAAYNVVPRYVHSAWHGT